MSRIHPYFIPAIAGLIITGVGGWGWLAANSKGISDNPVETSSESSSPPQANPDSTASLIAQPDSSVIPEVNPASTPQPTDAVETITLNIYRTDSQCETLIPEPVAVAAETPVTASVGNVVAQVSSGDLDLAGYRVNLDNGIATIDLRLSPDSQRQFVSLSMCEQLALFGSIRKTLLENPRLNIQDVRFTDKGQDIVF
ncbi:sporulation/spore germination protein [Coleofasciculus sp.]|uniref:sporulation/spore germination protein n=1 Tax=Coleofasciculus sp. TaxID=3100458 RepID=UPI003A15A24A